MTTSITTGIRRKQSLRLVLFVIILGTLPFYCAGIFLWGTATQNAGQRTPTGSATTRATVTPLATRTPGGVFPTSPGGFPTSGPLPNTPGQFFPPPVLPTFGFASPTFVFPPTSSPAPTLTQFVPPTATFIPLATATPLPFDTPVPDSDGDGVPDNLDPCPNDPYPGTGCSPTATIELGPPPLPSDTPLPLSP
ncbi:MAG TPA: thrombospondin type 3 repeat-containing protein [Candidatus Limnocylindrales bacterium]|nr:thrombospondin type 3 repeat-containing protein [Candidatus Limnocylindrales bacterium]